MKTFTTQDHTFKIHFFIEFVPELEKPKAHHKKLSEAPSKNKADQSSYLKAEGLDRSRM
jgi:hypothetical protein